MESSNRFKTFLVSVVIGLFALIVFGLIWFFFIGPATPVGVGWYLFSFAAGLTMIVLPCTLPLAFVIVPLSMGKGAAKGIGIAIAFGLGIAITLSMYGVIAAVVGDVAIGTIGAPLETVKNWLYFVAGAFAYIFALAEIGLAKYRMPTYTGAAPSFIQRRGDYLKALLLGLFLGNIGIGCPHPATPVILTRIAASGDVFYGWLLFFVHAAGRVLPLLLLAFLGILGVNALRWLVARKERVERATGWGMIFVASFILVLGLFSHDWWVYSGQHTLLEDITQEERFLGVISQKFNLVNPHSHDVPMGQGLFGLPLWLGNWVLVFLWILPLWWYYHRKRGEEPITRRLRFWFYSSLTLLLALTFIWVLPDRFLNHQHPERFMEMRSGEENLHAIEEHAAVYREEAKIQEGLAVNLNAAPLPIHTGSTTRLNFFVNEKPSGAAVDINTLEIEHEKLMHVVGVRNDMEEFFHIHPEPYATSSVFSIEHLFAKPGQYKLWSQVKKDGVIQTFGHPELTVESEEARLEKKIWFGRNIITGDYQVSLKLDEPVPKGRERDLSFDIHTLTGEEVEVENYLGAAIHLAVIKDDWSQFLHTHPEEMGDHHGGLHFLPEALAHGPAGTEDGHTDSGDETINFHITFPEAGLYRAFAQFRPNGISLPPDEALTASFWIQVQEKAPGIDLGSKPILTIISIGLLIILSWGVNEFLKTKTE